MREPKWKKIKTVTIILLKWKKLKVPLSNRRKIKTKIMLNKWTKNGRKMIRMNKNKNKLRKRQTKTMVFKFVGAK